MQVSIDLAEGLKRSLKIAVPANQVEQEILKRLRKLAQSAHIAGFRPGKIPFKVIEQRYSGRVRQEVVGEVLQRSFQEALAQENLTPVSGPQIEPLCVEAGKDLEYLAKFEIFPEVKLNAVADLQLKIPVVSIADQDVDEAIAALRKSSTQWIPVERPATDGDQIIIDYQGRIDGEAFAGGSAENVPLNLGAGQFLPEFERALQTVSKDQDVSFEMTFPADYAGADVAGKSAEFKVHVRQVNEACIPDLDSEFVKKMGIEDGGVEKLTQSVRGSLVNRVEQHLSEHKRKIVLEALYQANPMVMPEGLIHKECERLLQETKTRQSQTSNQHSVDSEPQLDDFKEQATRRVALSLILGELVDAQKLKADPARVKELAYSIAQNAPNPQEVMRFYYSDEKHLAQLETIAIEEAVVEWVVEHAKVDTEQKTYAQLNAPHSAADH